MSKRRNIKILLSSLCLSYICQSQAQVDQSVPSMNPTNNCLTNGAKEIPGIRNYEFLTSDDCHNIFVRPSAIGEQKVDYIIEQDLNLCKAVETADLRVVKMEEELSNLYDGMAKIMSKKATTDWAIKNKQKQISAKQEQIDWMNLEINKQITTKDKRYGDIPGARFSILSDGRVLDSDLVEIAKNNYYQVIVQEPGKAPEIFEKKPGVRRASIVDSYYSFFLRKAKEREDFASVISANAPVQAAGHGRRHGIVHVKANDLLPAEMVLNLPSICVGAEKNLDGRWQLTHNRKNPIFTVSRTYTVNQRAAYGYSSALKVPAMVSHLVAYIAKVGNRPFTVDEAFLEVAQSSMDSLLEFNWSQQLGTDGQNLSPKRVKELKLELFSGYLSNYFNQLVKNNVLKVTGSKVVGEKDGALVVNPNSKLKCYRSPLSKKCHMEAYSLVNWTGEFGAQLTTDFTVNQKFEKNVGVNQMEPFEFTSAFIPKFNKESQE